MKIERSELKNSNRLKRSSATLSGLLLGGLFLTLGTGCTQLTGKWSWKDWKVPTMSQEEESHDELPSRIMSIWTDAIHHQKGKPAERGFGGRVVFYGDSSTEPIQVNGTLMVYAFIDEDGKQSTKPDKQFRFTPDQLKQHYSRCSLGDSYSIWLPWDEVGGPSTQISLITRFDGAKGGTVLSDPARKLLPGASVRQMREEAIDSAFDAQELEPIRSSRNIQPGYGQANGSQEVSQAGLLQEDGSQRVSLASFVAGETSQTLGSNGGSDRVETVDLNQSNQSWKSQTMTIPTALGMRTNSTLSQSAYRNQASISPGTVDQRTINQAVLNQQQTQFGHSANNAEPTSIVAGSNGSSVAEQVSSQQTFPQQSSGFSEQMRVEQQSGATVFYGRPGQTDIDRNALLNQPVADATSGNNYQTQSNFGPAVATGLPSSEGLANQLSSSIDRRNTQLQSVKNSRQQFRSEPWRFPVRTQ